MDTELTRDFASYLDETGTLDEFCEQREMDTDTCRTQMTTVLTADTTEEPEEPAPEEPEMPDEVAMGADGTTGDAIETIVEDCVGRTMLGFSRPNEHACKRAFEKQEHRIERLEDRVGVDEPESPERPPESGA